MATWFFANAVPVNVHDRVCYLWAYGLPRDPAVSPEVTYESDYDMFIFRAYQANLGPTRQQMQRLINTGRYLMYLGTNLVSGYINGTSDNNSSRHERHYFEFEWIEMSVLDHDFYRMTAGNILAIHEYWDNLAIEAAVLSAKHYWATTTNAPPEIVEDAKGIPPVPQISESSSKYRRYLRHVPRQGWFLLLWIGSEFLLTLFKRSKGKAVSKDRFSLGLIWLVNTVAFTFGIQAAYRLPGCRIPWLVVSEIGYGLFAAGLVLRWYSVIYLGRFFTTNVAIATDHRVTDTGPYRWIRHPSYAGAQLTILGWCLTVGNWASLAIIWLPALAVQAWRIYVEEKALLEGLGEPYRSYRQRTKRLLPLIY